VEKEGQQRWVWPLLLVGVAMVCRGHFRMRSKEEKKKKDEAFFFLCFFWLEIF
jgi:hypothetical protein